MAKLDPRKEIFAIGKAAGRANKDLAIEIGITEKTASIWNRDPIVQAKIQSLQLEFWLDSQRILIALQKEAIETLARLMESQNEAIRLKAAATLLNLCSDFGSYF